MWCSPSINSGSQLFYNNEYKRIHHISSSLTTSTIIWENTKYFRHLSFVDSFILKLVLAFFFSLTNQKNAATMFMHCFDLIFSLKNSFRIGLSEYFIKLKKDCLRIIVSATSIFWSKLFTNQKLQLISTHVIVVQSLVTHWCHVEFKTVLMFCGRVPWYYAACFIPTKQTTQ